MTMKQYNKTIDWRKIQQGPAMDDEKEQGLHIIILPNNTV